MKRERLVIYPKDIQLITGKDLRSAQRLLRIIKKAYGKNYNQFLTIDEFCEFSGFSRQAIDQYFT